METDAGCHAVANSLSEGEMVSKICAAYERRRELREQEIGCYRMFHGWGEGIGGLDIDRYGDAITVRNRADLDRHLPAITDAIASLFRPTLVSARHRAFGTEPRALIGTIPSSRLVVNEERLSFLINFARAGNPGLYLDARPARQWLLANSKDRRILNLFSFTGSLGIAAAIGGAASVTHVDSHGPTLKWARANCELNGLRTDDRDFARLNVYQHLRKNSSGRQRYGGIILDPPPGSPSPRTKDRSPGTRGVSALAPLAARMLKPGGWLLCFFHHDARSRADLEAEVVSAADVEVCWRGTSGPDFPETDDHARLRIAAFTRHA